MLNRMDSFENSSIRLYGKYSSDYSTSETQPPRKLFSLPLHSLIQKYSRKVDIRGTSTETLRERERQNDRVQKYITLLEKESRKLLGANQKRYTKILNKRNRLDSRLHRYNDVVAKEHARLHDALKLITKATEDSEKDLLNRLQDIQGRVSNKEAELEAMRSQTLRLGKEVKDIVKYVQNNAFKTEDIEEEQQRNNVDYSNLELQMQHEKKKTELFQDLLTKIMSDMKISHVTSDTH